MEKRSSREILKTIYDYYDYFLCGRGVKISYTTSGSGEYLRSGYYACAVADKSAAVRKHQRSGAVLVEIMPVMFIPAAVGLMDSWGDLKPILVPFIVITFFVTVIVMVCGGHAAQFFIRRGKKQKKEETEEK